MKHTYTAKVTFEDGEVIYLSGDDVEKLLGWIQEQADSSFGETRGEIIDNTSQKVVKHFAYTPPE